MEPQIGSEDKDVAVSAGSGTYDADDFLSVA